jgi:hypothetical protein
MPGSEAAVVAALRGEVPGQSWYRGAFHLAG